MKQLLFALLILLFCSCKKEGTSTPPVDNTITNTTLLQAKWQLSSSVSNPAYDFNNDGVKETNRLSAIPVCLRTVIFDFVSNSAKVNCSATFIPFYWHLSDYGNTLNWHTGSNVDFQEKIQSINTITLQTTSEFDGVDGKTYTLTNTYSKL